MPGPQHTVSIAFVRSAIRALDADAAERALQVAGIAPDWLRNDQARVPATAFAALWMAVAQLLDDEFFGLDTRRMKVGSFALLCHAVAGQPTVARGLRHALRGFALFLDDIEARLTVAQGMARIAIHHRGTTLPRGGAAALPGASEDALRFADETLLVMIHGVLCWLAGRRVPLHRLQWAHPRPAHAEEYRRMFSPHVVFDQAATAVEFDARVLEVPVAISPGALAAFLRDAPQSVFLKQVQSGGWGERVRRQLRRHLAGQLGPSSPGEGPTLEALAAQFGLSPATLRRRLDDEGTGWQQLKDEVRRDLAIHRLADRRLSIVEVAAQLGYNDASSFHRAFRKWTGAAPGAYRAG